jgi:hypothetical protein
VQGRLFPRSIRDVIESREVGPVDPAMLRPDVELEVPVRLMPATVERDAIEWGAGGDALYGDTFVLLQVNQTVVLHNHESLLVSDRETRFGLTLRRSFLADGLEAELEGLYGMQGVYGVAHPRVTYDLMDGIDVRLGFVAIEGHEQSLLGQYRENDEGYVRIRYLF